MLIIFSSLNSKLNLWIFYLEKERSVISELESEYFLYFTAPVDWHRVQTYEALVQEVSTLIEADKPN